MGLSFYDETSLVETASDVRFAPDESDPDPILGTGSISQDASLCTGPDDPSLIPETLVNVRRDYDIGGSDHIQMVDR
jgi:hypothetical protein